MFAIEHERQDNMSTVISSMMQDVKEKKMSHMKNIKRLTMTKGELTEKQRTVKEKNVEIKKELDSLMSNYAECQMQYENKASILLYLFISDTPVRSFKFD